MQTTTIRSMPDRPAILVARGLIKRFGGVVALDGIDFDLTEGQITGLLGPNGSGKTTLFDTLSGFTRAERGTVTLNGRRVDGFSPGRLARTSPGLTRSFQEVRLFEQLTVLDNVLVAKPFEYGNTAFGVLRRFAIARELRKRRTEGTELLAEFSLADLRNRMAHRLSYGQRKLLEIARCLASESQIVLLDEPFAGVNPTLIGVICAVLRRAQEQTISRRTFFLVDHNRSVMTELCDRVLWIDRGRIVSADDGNLSGDGR